MGIICISSDLAVFAQRVDPLFRNRCFGSGFRLIFFSGTSTKGAVPGVPLLSHFQLRVPAVYLQLPLVRLTVFSTWTAGRIVPNRT